MAYSKETGVLLLDRTDSGRDSVWRLDTADGTNATPTQVMEGQSVRNAQWAGPDRFVYASHLDARSWIKLADLSGNDKKQLLQLWGNGSYDWFKVTPDQKQVFLFGSISNAAGGRHLAKRPGIRCLASGHFGFGLPVNQRPGRHGVARTHESGRAAIRLAPFTGPQILIRTKNTRW